MEACVQTCIEWASWRKRVSTVQPRHRPGEGTRNITVYVCVSVQKKLKLHLCILCNFGQQEEPAPCGDELVEFLKEFARWDPSQDSSDGRTELMRTLLLICKKQPVRNEIAGGSKVDQAVNATWAAMVYHTPALHHSLRSFG